MPPPMFIELAPPMFMPPEPPPEWEYEVVTGPRCAPAACAPMKIAASSNTNPHPLTERLLTAPPRRLPGRHRRDRAGPHRLP